MQDPRAGPSLMVDRRDRAPHDAVCHLDERGCDVLEAGHGAKRTLLARAQTRGAGDVTAGARLAGRRVLVVGAGTRASADPDAPIGNGRAISVLAAREGAV